MGHVESASRVSPVDSAGQLLYNKIIGHLCLLGVPPSINVKKGGKRMSGITRKGKHCFSLLAMLIGVLLSIAPVFGEEATSEPAAPEPARTAPATSGLETDAERTKVYMKIGTVTVTGKSDYLKTADLPAAVDILGADQIEKDNIDYTAELMKTIPGTYYGDFNQGSVTGIFSMRAFDANHRIPIAAFVDGIPHNWAEGSMFLHPVFPLEISRIELVKGTVDPRFGMDAGVGNINIYTKQGGNYIDSSVSYGSYNTVDGGIAVGKEDGLFSQDYFVGYRDSDGYRDHSDYSKGSVSGKWFYTPNDSLSVGFIARAFGLDANAPGYLIEREYNEDRTQMAPAATTDGGQEDVYELSLHVDYFATDNMTLSLKTYFNDWERVRWTKWRPTSTQQERILDEQHSGFILNAAFETDEMGIGNLLLEGGLDYQHMDNVNQRYETDNRVRSTLTRDWDFDQDNYGLFLKADAMFNDMFRLLAGMRLDWVEGDYTNRLNGTSSDMVDFDTIWQPKVGFVFTPLHGYNLFANWGRTFSLLPAPGRYAETDYDYSKNDGWEVGVKLSPIDRIAFRVSYWQLVSSDEPHLKADGSGDYENVGKTKRKGFDVELNAQATDSVLLWASYTHQQGEYKDNPKYSGQEIEMIPDYTAKVGVDVETPWGVGGRVWWQSLGKYWPDASHSFKEDGDFDVVNTSVWYTWDNMTLDFTVNNIFNEEYAEFVHAWNAGGTDGLTNFYSPADERSFYVTISMKY